MISLLEVAERARTGQKMGDVEWGMTLFKKLQELIARHDLKQEGPERYYEVDDGYADCPRPAVIRGIFRQIDCGSDPQRHGENGSPDGEQYRSHNSWIYPAFFDAIGWKSG